MILKQIYVCAILFFILLSSLWIPVTSAKELDQIRDAQRYQRCKAVEILTGVPWYYLAAMDQYERNITAAHKNKEKTQTEGLFSIRVPKSKWAGILNPDEGDMIPESIQFFQGLGRDANGDDKADPHDDSDLLYSIATFLGRAGSIESHIRERLWKYYQHPLAVDVITHIAKVYQKFQRIDLNEKCFPIPLQYNYTYHPTWGAPRGWGGLRIHEGTDIFADYGTPVLSTCYGYVELKGWNRFGGWRIGIRDTRNNYHYFAHLSKFRKGLKQGDIVTPGERIGSVGSSGYGPPGTSGKFEPHLHYGIYKFNGRNTYSYDPYSSLRQWEKKAYQKRKDKKGQKQKQPTDTPSSSQQTGLFPQPASYDDDKQTW
jgi:peptidoglycan LD-endopeptidase LytH